MSKKGSGSYTKKVTNESKAKHLISEFAADPFDGHDSAAADILNLKATLQSIIQTESGPVKDRAVELLGLTDSIIDMAKKAGKVAVVTVDAAVLQEQVQALAKQVGTFESKIYGYREMLAGKHAQEIKTFEEKWPYRPFARIPEVFRKFEIKSWDDYLEANTGDNVVKGKELECLSKAMAAVIMKVDSKNKNKKFDLEEADRFAANILNSAAFKKAFGNNGRLVEDYLKNRNIAKAIEDMNRAQKEMNVTKIKKEMDVKYEAFNKFLDQHESLKLGYEILSKKDADNNTNHAAKMVEDYYKARGEENEMMEAKIMTVLLKEAEPVTKAIKEGKTLEEALAGLKEKAPEVKQAVKEPEGPVLQLKPISED